MTEFILLALALPLLIITARYVMRRLAVRAAIKRRLNSISEA
jgi:hypothetical protein